MKNKIIITLAALTTLGAFPAIAANVNCDDIFSAGSTTTVFTIVDGASNIELTTTYDSIGHYLGIVGGEASFTSSAPGLGNGNHITFTFDQAVDITIEFSSLNSDEYWAYDVSADSITYGTGHVYQDSGSRGIAGYEMVRNEEGTPPTTVTSATWRNVTELNLINGRRGGSSVFSQTIASVEVTALAQPTNYVSIPEPTTYAMVLGVVGLVVAATRRRRNQERNMNSGKGLALGMSKMKSPAARTGVWGLSKKMIKMNHLPAKTWNSLRGRGGFSLIELLVVIAVLGILAAILVGGIQKTLTKSKLISSGSNLRQLASAVHLYNSENNGKYPMLRGSSAAGESWQGPFWPDQIRPFLQMEPGEKGSALHCPLEENHHPTMSDYGNNPFVIRNDFNKGPVRGVNITNPTGIILFVMTRDTVKERGEWFLPQSYPASPSAATLRPHDRGSGKIMAVFVDGHLEEFTPEEMDRRAVELFLPTL